jgi:hypothetical protein
VWPRSVVARGSRREATDDEVVASFDDDFGDLDKVQLAGMCAAMVTDLCEGPTSQTFDQPVRGCSGDLPPSEPGR